MFLVAVCTLYMDVSVELEVIDFMPSLRDEKTRVVISRWFFTSSSLIMPMPLIGGALSDDAV